MKKRTQKENLKRKGGLRALNKEPKNGIVVILDNIKSMFNVGAIFRTCEGARVEKIILCGITATPPRDKIYKTSMGTVDMVQWQYYKKTENAIADLKKSKYTIVALEQTDSSKHYQKAQYNFPIAVVLGHEKNGVSKAVLNQCDFSVEIPMYGRANSLNVATSAGIIIYEILSRTRR